MTWKNHQGNNKVNKSFSFLGVLDLIIVATKDEMIGEKIKSLSWKIQSEGVRVTVL